MSSYHRRELKVGYSMRSCLKKTNQFRAPVWQNEPTESQFPVTGKKHSHRVIPSGGHNSARLCRGRHQPQPLPLQSNVLGRAEMRFCIHVQHSRFPENIRKSIRSDKGNSNSPFQWASRLAIQSIQPQHSCPTSQKIWAVLILPKESFQVF